MDARLLDLERRVRDLEAGVLSRTYWPVVVGSTTVEEPFLHDTSASVMPTGPGER